MATMNDIFAGYTRRKTELEKSTNALANGVAWVEGEILPMAEARIPLTDQGFLHGDLTYDVPSVWDGRFFRLNDHITRLSSSCDKMRMQLPLPAADIKHILVDMVARSGIRDAFVEIIVTRGLKGVRDAIANGTHTSLTSKLYMFVLPYIWVMDPATQLVGGSAIVARTVRRTPPGSFDPTIKNLQWGDLTRGMYEAADRGAIHAFLTDGDANLTEGSGFNIVFIKDKILYTADRGVLEGVTRKSVFDVARANDIEVRCQVVPVELAYQSDEIFMCTTAGGIMPITTLDDKPVNDGKIGPITRLIWDQYWAMHYDPTHSFEIDYAVDRSQTASARARL